MGATWGDEMLISYNDYANWQPVVAVNGAVVHIVWSAVIGYNWEILYISSDDGGLTWGYETRLTDDYHASYNPSISVSGSFVHVVWNDDREVIDGIYYKRSEDGGLTWEEDKRLTWLDHLAILPSVSAVDSLVHVVFYAEKGAYPNVYYMHSLNTGQDWEKDTCISCVPSTAVSANVVSCGLLVHVVWQDNRDGNFEIYYKRSTDGGISWEPDLRLTYAPSASGFSSVAVSDSTVHVLWTDHRYGNDEIF